MSMSLQKLRLQKSAFDNGFDLEQPADDGWLAFASTKCPLRIWLRIDEVGQPLIALSQERVVSEVAPLAAGSMRSPLAQAETVLATTSYDSLYDILRRAFRVSRALPFELLHSFQESVATLPQTTEAERIVVQRVGQNIYRDGLIDYWDGRCAVAGLDVVEILRASHSKPWADCSNDAERLDVFNGFLLAPQLDALFDRGLMTISFDGTVEIASSLPPHARKLLGLCERLQVSRITDSHRQYLRWHRDHVFQSTASGIVADDAPRL